MTMHNNNFDWVMAALQQRRARLVGEVVDTEAELHSIQGEREIELEELAQEDRAARTLAQLDDRAKHEIAEIDAAIQRLAEGTYGLCEGCGEPIARERLRVVPAARFCVDCAREQERSHPGTPPEESVQHPGRVPPDLRLLSDRELEQYVQEQVREDGRVDLDELRLVCRHGVVHLEGALPSEAEHSILLQLLTDVLGLEDVVDHLRSAEVLWEREARSKAERTAEPLPEREPSETEDIVESLEEGVEYVPPVSPTPEEE
jgi:RNA polymerase-binding protein DksA